MANSTINDFLRFSAYSIKELITRKLSEDSKFTDQVYEGSNLAILIDIVSYMYQCLIYNINNAASESMFSDTQMYENISRLCRFIGYHPQGFKPAQVKVYIDNSTIINRNPDIYPNIYPCSALDTGLYDSNGKKIYFSTVFDNTKARDDDYIETTRDQYTYVMLTNGLWKKYSTTFIANGNDYETFVLDGLQSDSNAQKYVADNKIQVFIEYANPTANGVQVERWDPDPNEIFIQAYNSSSFGDDAKGYPIFSKLYNEDSKVYTVYLNENKTYEIKFGNGVLGKKLSSGDKVHVLYLDTNGPDGYIDFSEVDITASGRRFEHSASLLGMSSTLYKQVFDAQADSQQNIANCGPYTMSFSPSSLTQPQHEEGVLDIRENAPQWFKTGSRLITKKDYEYFIKSNRSSLFSNVVDVKCMNNWDYLTTFYRWLYNMALSPIEYARANGTSPYKYLAKSRLVQAGYEYVDAADANNIYLWIATSNQESDILQMKADLNNSISQIKTMTSETYPLSPVNVYFDISFTPDELYYTELTAHGGDNSFDSSMSYLEVTIADNTVYSTTQVLNNVAQIIENAFYMQKCRLGQTVVYDSILNQIYGINGVERVRTVFYPEDYLEEAQAAKYTKYKTRVCDGIAFASWSSTPLINVGDDLQINNTNRALEDFQFPKLVPGLDVKSKIKVIKKSMNTTSPIKF